MPNARPRAPRGASPGHLVLVIAAAALFFFAAGRLVRPLLFSGEVARVKSPEGTARFDLSDLQVERMRIESGGVAKDGIVALDTATTRRAADVDHLPDDERMVVVAVDDEQTAYPVRMLRTHEIINDRIGGVDLSVVYCPLCDSISVVERGTETGALDGGFGVSGQLFESNILMYDRETDALWSQVQGKAMSGPNAGQRLVHRSGWSIEPFGDLQARQPDLDVAVHADDDMASVYTIDPYRGYFANDTLIFEVSRRDARLPIKARVLGVHDGTAASAYELGTIARLGVADAMDDAVPGRLEVTLDGGALVAEVELDDAGVPSRLRVIDAPEDAVVVHSFWFAWASSHPTTDLVADDASVATVVAPPADGPLPAANAD